MAEDRKPAWQEFFSKWPEKLPKRGLLVSTLNEVTPFKSFLLRTDMLVLERTNPDPVGSRYILMQYDAIHMVKLIDPLKEEVFASAGFTGHFVKM
jgi:hypothetical protein